MRHSYTGFDVLARQNFGFLQSARFSCSSRIEAVHSHEGCCILFEKMLGQSRFNPNWSPLNMKDLSCYTS